MSNSQVPSATPSLCFAGPAANAVKQLMMDIIHVSSLPRKGAGHPRRPQLGLVAHRAGAAVGARHAARIARLAAVDVAGASSADVAHGRVVVGRRLERAQNRGLQLGGLVDVAGAADAREEALIGELAGGEGG